MHTCQGSPAVMVHMYNICTHVQLMYLAYDISMMSLYIGCWFMVYLLLYPLSQTGGTALKPRTVTIKETYDFAGEDVM